MSVFSNGISSMYIVVTSLRLFLQLLQVGSVAIYSTLNSERHCILHELMDCRIINPIHLVHVASQRSITQGSGRFSKYFTISTNNLTIKVKN